MKFTFRDIVWVGIITLILVVLSKCHSDKNDSINASLKILHEKHVSDSLSYSKEIISQEHRVNESVYKADSLNNINQVLETKLDDKANTILRLTAALQKAKQLGIDTNFITVDQDYVDYCDSLAIKSSGLALDYFTYKKNNAALIVAKDEIIKAKDGIINIERNAKQSITNDYNALTRIYQDYQKANKAKNQFYIGAELIGNPTYFVNNVGLAISLKTKSNKLWQISGGIQTNGQYYARINGNILIKLKP